MSGTIVSNEYMSEESKNESNLSQTQQHPPQHEINPLGGVHVSTSEDMKQHTQTLHPDISATINDMLEELLNYTPPVSEITNISLPQPQQQQPHHQQPPQNMMVKAEQSEQFISSYNVNREDTKGTWAKIKTIYSGLSFGRTEEIHDTQVMNPQPFLQLNELHLPFHMNVSGLPTITRAENQMNLNLTLTRNKQVPMVKKVDPKYAHLPTNAMAKEKLYLTEDNEYLQGLPNFFTDKVLFIDAFLIAVPTNQIANVCEKCVVREKKRYSRRKSGLCDNILWCNNPNRNAILFSNRQLFPISNYDQDSKQISIGLKTRLTCYCKHHENTDAFKLLFVIRDSQSNIIAKSLTDSVVIMGRKSEAAINKSKLNATNMLTPNINTTKKFITSSESPIQAQMLKTHNNDYHFPSPSSSSQSEDNTNHSNSEDQISRNNSQPNLSKPNTSASQSQISLDKNLVSEGYYDLIFNQNKNNMNISNNFTSPQDNNTPISSNSSNSNINTPIFTDNSLTGNDFDMRKRSRNNYETTPSSLSFSPAQNSFSVPPPLKNNMNSGVQHDYSMNLQHLPMSIQNNPNFNNQMRPDAFSSSYSSLPTLIPSIHKVIPGQGSISGGIEITLLGSNFKPGQIVEFGENMALSSQVWNSTTMVTFLPPAAKAGQVIVSVRDPNSRDINRTATNNSNSSGSNDSSGSSVDDDLSNKNGPVFTYIDDSDKQIIELALQIVGLKMNGKLDDPRNIARQIVDSTNQNSNNGNNNYNGQSYNNNQQSPGNNYMINGDQTDFERLLIDIVNGTKDFNFTLRDEMGRTMLHYSCLKGYKALTKLLVQESSHGLCQREDNFGYLPVHFAAINGSTDIINLVDGFISGSKAVTQNGYTARDLYIFNHSDEQEFTDSESEWSDYSDDNDSQEVLRSIDTTQPQSQEELATDDQSNSLWNRMMNKLNDDILPKYEDIFPKEYFDYSMNNSKMTELIDTHDQQSAGVLRISGTHGSEEDEEDEEEEEDEDDTVEEYFEKMMSYQKEINFKNDKMLLYFWLPLLVFLLSAMILYSFGNSDDWIHYINDAVSKFTRSLLTTMFVGRENMSISIKNRLSNFQPSKMLKDLPKTIDQKLTV